MQWICGTVTIRLQCSVSFILLLSLFYASFMTKANIGSTLKDNIDEIILHWTSIFLIAHFFTKQIHYKFNLCLSKSRSYITISPSSQHMAGSSQPQQLFCCWMTFEPQNVMVCQYFQEFNNWSELSTCAALGI